MKHLLLASFTVVAFVTLTTFCNKYDTYPQTTYRIAMATDTPPFSYTETGPDNTTVQKGIEYEALCLIAEQQNIKYQIVTDTWNACYNALVSDKVDAFMSTLSATEERKQVFDFYVYSEEPLSIATLGTNTDIHSLADLQDKIVVVIPNSISMTFALSIKDTYNLSVLEIANYNDRYNAVVNGIADALIEETALIKIAVRDYFPSLKIAADTQYSSPIGFAVKKGKNATLLQKFGAGFEIIKENKRWKSLVNKYLGD